MALRKTSKSLWPVTSWADLLFVWKTKPLCWAAGRWHSASVFYCHGGTTSQGAFRASVRQYRCCPVKTSESASTLLEVGYLQVNKHSKQRAFGKLLLERKHSWVSRRAAGVKSKILQSWERCGLIVEAKWISCLDSLILQRVYQGRSNYICLIAAQAKNSALNKDTLVLLAWINYTQFKASLCFEVITSRSQTSAERPVIA